MITGVRAPEHPDGPGSGETVTTVQDLVTFARNRPRDADRATALIGLVPFLTEGQPALVLEDGLGIEDELERCRVMDAVAPRATPAQLQRLLAGTLKHSPASPHTSRAVSAATNIGDPQLRAATLGVS
jgi:hypothetical protein